MTFTFFGAAFQLLLLWYTIHITVHYPNGISTIGLASFAFARHYSRNLGWFLFLCLLRCFSSAGSLPVTMYSSQDHTPSTYGVSPFGHLRIDAYLLLPEAYRSLSRPSSAPGAKAFPLYSSSLELSWFSLAWVSQIGCFLAILAVWIIFQLPYFRKNHESFLIFSFFCLW